MIPQTVHIEYDLVAKNLWNNFKSHIKYLSITDQEVVELAFIQMVEAHTGQMRKSGEFYIVHPVAAATYLTRIGLDKDTLAACLMHDVPEDTHVSLKDLEQSFSKEIVFLISGITKLSKIKYQGEDRYVENLRRMFVAMSRDLRVIFIKLADRLHNLQTLKALPPHKAQRIAMESLEIYVPIAQRLGINYFKGEIEDAAFPYVYPHEYKQFISLSNIEIEKRKKLLEKMINKTKGILELEGVEEYSLKGRAKKYYSIFCKLQDMRATLDSMYDLVALRILVPTEDDCYHVLSLIHKHFEPHTDRLKDYIATPKENGYQSLHTSVTDNRSGLVFEFQIRTFQMHEFAEFGVAAHWAYKAKKKNDSDRFLESQNFKWISELVDLGRENLTQEEYLKHVKLDLFQDRIFVMTPKNDVIDLPKGATPLDFAYRIHEQIGSSAVMAKVNNRPAKLSDELHSGDEVVIVTGKHQKPKLDWLNWVKTHTAAKQIRARLRKNGQQV